MKEILLATLIGYLLGNIQASYLLGRILYKVDIRTLGHGNAGASNALSSIGWKFGLYVAIIDVLKGILSIVIIKYLFDATLENNTLLLYVNGFSAMLGHIFPFYMNFKGGKGTATLLGVLLGIHPLIGIAAILLLIALTFLLDYVALSALIIHVLVLVITYIAGFGWTEIAIAAAMLALSIYLHTPNIKRMKNNTEGRLSSSLYKKKNEN